MTDATESLRAALGAYRRIFPPRGDIALGAGPTFRCECGKVSRLLLNGWVDAADKLATSSTAVLARLDIARQSLEAAERERDALRELVEAERDLPLKIEPDYDDPQYTEKHKRAADARKAAGMPLPRHPAALARDEKTE